MSDLIEHVAMPAIRQVLADFAHGNRNASAWELEAKIEAALRSMQTQEPVAWAYIVDGKLHALSPKPFPSCPHPLYAAPVSPAGAVAGDIVQAAFNAYTPIASEHPHEGGMEAAVAAVLSALEPAPVQEAVAWQWRYRTRQAQSETWGEWSGWTDGRGPIFRGDHVEAEERPLYASPAPAPADTSGWKRGDRVKIEHDGFVGTLLDPYTTLEGKRGWTVQLDNARVVHVYGEKWLIAAPSEGA